MSRATPVGSRPFGPDALYERIAPRFSRSEVRDRLRQYVEGLLSLGDPKNCWRLAEHAGERNPDGMQRLLSTSRWDADAVRDDLREYVVARLSGGGTALAVGQIGFRRRGDKSAGVAKQLNPCSKRVENCQVGVFLAFAGAKGQAFIDRELYLPEDWVTDRARREAALVPESVGFASRQQLALRMLARAKEAGVSVSWVVGGETFGGDESLRGWLEQVQQPFVLGVAPSLSVSPDGPWHSAVSVEDLSATLPSGAWTRPGDSATPASSRDYEWALASVHGREQSGFQHWLLSRRDPERLFERAYYLVFAPVGTAPAEMARAANLRRVVRESADTAKRLAGLAGYEVRHWDGWYRHVTLSFLAHAFLALGLAESGGKGRDAMPAVGSVTKDIRRRRTLR